MWRRRVAGPATLLLAALCVSTADPSWAGATRVALVDACLQIDIAFCQNGGTGGSISDLPAFISGFVIYNEPAGRFSMVTLMVNGSLPDAPHFVFRCPGALLGGVNGGGFTGCALIGSFLTNVHGDGAFHAKLDATVTDTVIAINVPPFATVLANHPDDPIQ